MNTSTELTPEFLEATRQKLKRRVGQYLAISQKCGVSYSFITHFANDTDKRVVQRKHRARAELVRKLDSYLTKMDKADALKQ